MMHATFAAAQVNAARAQGKESWVYDGVRPRTGTFLVDDDAVSPRVNGWLSAMFHVPRWIVQGSIHWYAEHGDVPVDPFADAESFRSETEWANGDGMLLYPGTQLDAFEEHSLGDPGVLASIRLKNWRRGIEDAGYLQMAHDRDPARADAVARWLVPAAFDGEAQAGDAPSWGSRGKPVLRRPARAAWNHPGSSCPWRSRRRPRMRRRPTLQPGVAEDRMLRGVTGRRRRVSRWGWWWGRWGWGGWRRRRVSP